MVSIIVPVYNSEKYIERCIVSVMKQTNPNWELIIVDDGSTDKSADIIDRIARNEKKIRYYYQNNSGAGMARNLGITKATGDYIAFLDSDDYLSKDYIESIEQHDSDVIFLDLQRVEKKKRIIESISKYRSKSIDDLIRYQMTSAIPGGGVPKGCKKTNNKK